MANLQRNLSGNAQLREIPAIQRRPLPQPLAQIAEAHARDEVIHRAYTGSGYSLKEIGAHFGLDYSRIRHILKNLPWLIGDPMVSVF